MIFDILTIFPGLLASPLEESIVRRAREMGKVTVNITNIRDFAVDKHAMTDDRPFGGGEGMVMKAEPLAESLKSISQKQSKARVALLSPQGNVYDQEMARKLSRESHLILICGRYEGVDERFIEKYVTDEISIGDYILTGGELAAMVLVDSITRLLPGVLGCQDSASKDTFSRKMLKHPQYTRPRVFEDIPVPQELLSGDHSQIEIFRFLASVQRTMERRPELLAENIFSKDEIKLLKQHGLYASIKELQKQDEGQ